MPIEPWNGVLNNGDYHYIRLTFTGPTENTNPSVRFAVRNSDTTSWITIPNTEENTADYTSHYITENIQTDSSSVITTKFITGQLLNGDDATFLTELNNLGASVVQLNFSIPSTLYFPIYWTTGTNNWSITSPDTVILTDPFSNSLVPCFSEKTMTKLLKNVPSQIPVVLVRSIRCDKKMYRIIHNTMGELEFTDDHPINYKGQTYPFAELVKIHPAFKNNYSIIDEMELGCSKHNYVYNFMIDPNHTKFDATIKLDDEMSVVGMTPFEHFGRKLQKKLELMCVLMDNKVNLTSHMSNNVNNFITSRETDYVYLKM